MSANTLSRLQGFLLIAVVVLAVQGRMASPALAQSDAETRAKALYKKGKTQYDLGNFPEAIEIFKEAYSIFPFPNLLYNIAQSYRQQGSCQAMFFYKRYLQVAGPKAKNHKTVETRIKELETTCKAVEDGKVKPPPGTISVDKGATSGVRSPGSMEGSEDTADEGGTTNTEVADNSSNTDGTEDETESDEVAEEPVVRKPAAGTTQRVWLALEGGPAFLDLGGLDIGGAHFSLSASGGYPVALGKASIDLGGVITYTPLPWVAINRMEGTANLIGLLGNVTLRYWPWNSLNFRASLGAGVLALGGALQDSVFIAEGSAVEGSLGMFNVRFGIGLDYVVAEHFLLSLSPFSYSYSPSKTGINEDIDSFVRIEVMGGLGYRI